MMNDGTGFAVVIVGLLLMLYLLPAIIATCRGHQHQVAIWVVTILLGWSMIGWIAALAWSFVDTRRAV